MLYKVIAEYCFSSRSEMLKNFISALLVFMLILSVVQTQGTSNKTAPSVSKSPPPAAKSGNDTETELPPLSPPPKVAAPPGGFDPDKLGLGAGNQLSVGVSLILGCVLSLAMMII